MDSFDEGNFASGLYVDSEFFPRITERLFEMQRNRTLCDVQLGLSNALHSLSVHRCVLAANSPAFCALLGEDPSDEVTITMGNAVVVESLIEYMYTGRLRVSLSSARDLLRLGKNCMIGNVVCLVEQHLSKSLNLSTWVEILRIACEFKMMSIELKTAEFLAANVDKILEEEDVDQLDYDLVRRIVLTGSQSVDGWDWKVPFILHWCESAHSEHADRVAELLDLINFKDVDTFALKVRLHENPVINDHDTIDFASQHCPSDSENSEVMLNSTNISTDNRSSRESFEREFKTVSEIAENGVEQITMLKEEATLANERQMPDRHCDRTSKKKRHWSELYKTRRSLESSKNESVSILSSQQTDDQEMKLSKASAEELSMRKTDRREQPNASESSILPSRNALETDRKPNGSSQAKQLFPSSSNIKAVSVSRGLNSEIVGGDDHKKTRRVRVKRAKTADEMYNCPLCPKRFPTSAAQRRHTKGHGSETPILCDICGFSTKHRASMNVHNQIHFGKRFECRFEGCSYSAIRYTDIEDHYNTHKGIKSHVCSVCGKAFSHRRHHARHEKIHTNAEKFSCSKCKYYTGRSDKLREHDRRHHQPKEGEETIEVGAGKGKGRKRTREKRGAVKTAGNPMEKDKP